MAEYDKGTQGQNTQVPANTEEQPANEEVQGSEEEQEAIQFSDMTELQQER